MIPEIILPNESFTGFVINVTDTVTFECIATGIPPPAIQWFRGGMLLTPDGLLGSGQSLVSTDELNSRLKLGEPSQMMIPTPAGRIYQVERTLTFNTNGPQITFSKCTSHHYQITFPELTTMFRQNSVVQED